MYCNIYASYGSNLNHVQMAMRCPLAKFIGCGRLNNYQLVFRSVADIEYTYGASVAIGLWKITEDCLEALDRYEGYPSLYDRSIFEINVGGGKTKDAWAYQMIADDYAPPTKAYFKSIADGYRHCKLPINKLNQDLQVAKRLYLQSKGESYA